MIPPTYERGGVRMWCGDCLDILPTLDVQVDAVVTDPPYGITSCEWDKRVPGWMNVLSRVLVLSGSVWAFGSLRSLVAEFQAGSFDGWKMAQDVIWEKHNGSNFHNDRFRRVHEIVAQFYRGEWSQVYKSPVYTPDAVAKTVRRKTRPTHMGHIEKGSYVSVDGGPRLQRSVLRVRSCHGRAVHPTQKPTGIVEPLIEYSCPPDAFVLDPFMGSGTTIEAAIRMNRRAIGIELDPHWFAVARNRIDRVLDQGVLF